MASGESFDYNDAMAETVEVACAIIRARKAGEETFLLIAQRKLEDFLGGYWEFPGGKIEGCESVKECLVREVYEELGVCIRPAEFFCHKEHVYPEKTVRLHFYFCDWVSGVPAKRDCLDFCWVRPEEMKNYNFIPADTEIINELIRGKEKYF